MLGEIEKERGTADRLQPMRECGHLLDEAEGVGQSHTGTTVCWKGKTGGGL